MGQKRRGGRDTSGQVSGQPSGGEQDTTAGRRSGQSEETRGGAESGPCPVVMLGASAGGLEALSQFFSAVPDNTGIAFVVIQHLAPGRASSLPELLGHHTKMETGTAEDGDRLRPNHVYVIPPGQLLSVSKGRLHLSEAQAEHRMPIDHFLRTLAQECRGRAVAVILSGTGSDGTIGVQAIKAEDGLVGVQSPETAAYPGMPNSAIEHCRVDFVLPVEDMPRAITGYLQQDAGIGPGEDTGPEPAGPWALPEILRLLHQRTGHDFSEYKTSTILRRIARRMAILGAAAHADYTARLRQTPEELDRLFAELLIPVTRFFRDPEAFAALQERVLPNILKDHGESEELRVWVPGCSTGEEAYSIAILVVEAMEAGKHRLPVQIFATDIDATALETARRGRYPVNIDADVPAEHLRRYFQRDGDFYEVRKAIRDMIVFAEQDVVRDPPFSRVDLVSCRNLLIYMNASLQQRVLPVFHYALRPGGYLFLGAAETVGKMDDLFIALDAKWKLFRRRDDQVARRLIYALPQFASRSTHAASAPAPRTAEPGARYGAIMERLLLRDHVPTAALVDGHDELLYLHGSTGNFLQPAAGQPSTAFLPMVRPGLEGLVRDAIKRVRGRKSAVSNAAAHILLGKRPQRVSVTAHGLDEPDLPHGSVLLTFTSPGTDAGPETAGAEPSETITSDLASDGESAQLRQELAETREALQATIEELETSNEELQSSNEELQSSNEELQSSNEELETSREELQSVNEELRSVNTELEQKVGEATQAKQDMNALLASTEIGVVFVDADLQIERFTPAVTEIIPVREGDLGRPIDDLSPRLRYENLHADMQSVLHNLESMQRRVEGRDGHTYMMRMRPYRGADGRVVGVVLVFVDVTEEVERAFLGKLRDALGQSEEMVMLVDLEGGVEYVNDAFCRATGYEPAEVVGRVPDALANPNLSPEDRRAMTGSLRNGRGWRGEFLYRTRDGSRLETEAFFAPIRTTKDVTHAVAFLRPSQPHE